jgi:hypothetical protein
MTAYIKLSTLEYPRHEGDIRLEHPEIREDQTWPNFPCPDTYALVEWIDPPTIDGTTQIVELQQPIQENGVWKMIWAVRDLTVEELESRARWITEMAQRNAQRR